MPCFKGVFAFFLSYPIGLRGQTGTWRSYATVPRTDFTVRRRWSKSREAASAPSRFVGQVGLFGPYQCTIAAVGQRIGAATTFLNHQTASNHRLHRTAEFCGFGLVEASVQEQHLMRFNAVRAKDPQDAQFRSVHGRLYVVNTSPQYA